MKTKMILLTAFLYLVPLSQTEMSASVLKDAHVTAQLISEVQSIQPGSPFWVGLHLKMDPGWHTYWRNPGDSGLPTTLEWKLPDGYQAGTIQWPTPKAFSAFSLSGYGYEGEVMLLVQLVPPSSLTSEAPQSLRANARWLSCEKICIPGSGDFELTLPVATTLPEADPEWERLFQKTRARLPVLKDDPSIKVSVSKKSITFHFHSLDSEMQKVHFFPYSEELLDHSAPQNFRWVSQGAELTVSKSVLYKSTSSPIEGVLVFEKGREVEAREIKVRVQPANRISKLFLLGKVSLVFLGVFMVGWSVRKHFF